MSSESLESLLKQSDDAFKRRDFDLAFDISEKLAKKNVPSAMFTCGLIMERGWSREGVNIDEAWNFYKSLAINFNDDEGYLGCVRIILVRRDISERKKAEVYCRNAMNGRLKHLANILLGRIYEEMYEPPRYKSARKEYLKSFFSGSVWALRKYSMSLMKSGNYLGGSLMHVITTIISPFFVLIGGIRTTRTG